MGCSMVETELGPVSAVALYGLMDELSDASVHRSLSELSPVLDDPKYNKQVILGGDLNTGTQWPKGEVFYTLFYALALATRRRRP